MKTGDTDSLNFIISSELANVHEVISESQGLFREHGTHAATRISVVLRELLANAIMHGNQNVASKIVKCRVEKTEERTFRITVEDEGEGFDFASLDTSLPEDPRNVRKRGYILIRSICTSLEFNGPGNRVTVLIRVHEQAPVKPDSGDGEWTLTDRAARTPERESKDSRQERPPGEMSPSAAGREYMHARPRPSRATAIGRLSRSSDYRNGMQEIGKSNGGDNNEQRRVGNEI
jgi:anti-sigma regulatory factor (Ser/Thr protein kinase)